MWIFNQLCIITMSVYVNGQSRLTAQGFLWKLKIVLPYFLYLYLQTIGSVHHGCWSVHTFLAKANATAHRQPSFKMISIKGDNGLTHSSHFVWPIWGITVICSHRINQPGANLFQDNLSSKTESGQRAQPKLFPHVFTVQHLTTHITGNVHPNEGYYC